MFKRKRPQEEIFANFDWWDKNCFLYQMTGDRCDYIESCINRVFGKGALAQQEILEVGCGGGLIFEHLARRKAVMVGLRSSSGAVDTARTHPQQVGLAHNIHYVQGFAEQMPFADSSFSAIVCLDVLEHVNTLQATIAEIARVLAPAAAFLFATTTRTSL